MVTLDMIVGTALAVLGLIIMYKAFDNLRRWKY